MPPIEYRADTVKTEAEIIARVKGARERLRGPAPRPFVLRPPRPAAAPPLQEQPPLEPCQPPDEAPDIAYSRTRIPVRAIIEAICRRYNLTYGELISDRRQVRLTRPRGIGYYIAAKLTTLSYPAIAKAFGRTDHSTVFSGLRGVERQLLDSSSETARAVEEIIAGLQAKFPNAVAPPRLASAERTYNPLYPNNGKPYSQEDIALLRRLIGEGRALSIIAQELGRPPRLVRQKAVRMGILARVREAGPRKAIKPPPRRPRWTRAQHEQLQHLISIGEAPTVIAPKLGKSRSAIWNAIRRLEPAASCEEAME